MTLEARDLEALIRDVPGFPREGVVFKDITTLLTHGGALTRAVELMEREARDIEYDAIASIESRGFVFGGAMAVRAGLPLVLIRKQGKLPADTIGIDYSLEYGTARVEMHRGSLGPGARVLIVDDLLATGGSALAAAGLLQRDGCRAAGALFLISLEFLGGRSRLEQSGLPTRFVIGVDG
ncbi:adenine phosphoribosyltransferase [Candidatus Fermentibacterales bacterium]|nr:adenine phosphoribosyltransferase [Candidatus Fermentibacterales bacterium]